MDITELKAMRQSLEAMEHQVDGEIDVAIQDHGVIATKRLHDLKQKLVATMYSIDNIIYKNQTVAWNQKIKY